MQPSQLRTTPARSRLLAVWFSLAGAACAAESVEDSASSAQRRDAETDAVATRDEDTDAAVEEAADAAVQDVAPRSSELDARSDQPTQADAGVLDADVHQPTSVLDAGATTEAMVVGNDSEASVAECRDDAACSMCSVSSCGDPGTLLSCHDGRVEYVACLSSQTCLDDSLGIRCGGVCRKGKRSCSASGKPQVCDGTGSWRADPGKSSCSAQEICDKWSPESSDVFGTCVNNEPRVRGYMGTQGAVLEPAFGDFIAVPVRMEEDYYLARMGALTVDGATPAEDNQGGQSLMFVYADTVVDGKHRPGQILTYSFARDLVVGGNSWSPINSGVVFAAGTLYWIAIDINGAPGDQTRLYRLPAQATGDGLGVIEWAKKVPATVPERFPLENATREENAAVSLYLQVQRYWH